MLLLTLFSIFSFHEWWIITVIAESETLKQYRFGVEGPVAGSLKYQSAKSYSTSCVLDIIFSLTFCALFAYGYYKGDRIIILSGYCVIGGIAMYSYIKYIF